MLRLVRPTPADRRGRDLARQMFMKARAAPLSPGNDNPLGVGAHKALEQVVDWLDARTHLPDYAPPADYDLLAHWCADEQWETTYRRGLISRLLDGVDDPTREVRYLRDLQRDARRVLDLTIEGLRVEPDAAYGVPDVFTESFGDATTAGKAEFQKYAIALDKYRDITKDLLEAESALRARSLEQARDEQYVQRVDEVYLALYGQYEGLGPQYELLCRQAAESQVRFEYASQSGRTLSIEEATKLQTGVREAIQALQKHTEATRSESVSKEGRDMVIAALSIVEDVVAPSQPQLWERIVLGVQQRLTRQMVEQRGGPSLITGRSV